ncbi:hypothetical protein F9802_06665 [Bacillus aerolatus]|uniref:Transposase IS200-like domain-containing protein n=1 Tax=Bacillus aerolatus TaxID=2653354 RepID=A0A6I1FM55_9BACI|nr:hypothetical protein F9802_06665 [Bacillus aerolatus]
MTLGSLIERQLLFLIFHLLQQYTYIDFPISIYAFCTVTNHCHLLLKFKECSISTVMTIFNKYCSDYYNCKCQHLGYVF